jgi:cytochrome b561
MQGRHAPTAVERYSTTAQLLHWATALLVVLAYITSLGGSETRVYSPANDFDRGLHELFGISVFALTLVRVSWRTAFPPPESPDLPIWMELGARLAH